MSFSALAAVAVHARPCLRHAWRPCPPACPPACPPPLPSAAPQALPYELRALEAALLTVVRILNHEVQSLESTTHPGGWVGAGGWGPEQGL